MRRYKPEEDTNKAGEMAEFAGKVPGWVARFLIPEIERVVDQRLNSLKESMNTRFQAVDTRFEALEKTMNARFEAVDAKFEALEKTMNAKFEAMEARFRSLEDKFSIVQDVAVLKAEVRELRQKLEAIPAT